MASTTYDEWQLQWHTKFSVAIQANTRNMVTFMILLRSPTGVKKKAIEFEIKGFQTMHLYCCSDGVTLNVQCHLTHWGRMTHIFVSKLTTTGRRQAIIWINAVILFTGPLGTKFSEILIEIHTFSLNKIRLQFSSGKWRPFCLGLNVFMMEARVISLGLHSSSHIWVASSVICCYRCNKFDAFEWP